MVITYLGQAAYLWDHADDVNNTFYASIPDPVYWPMFVIATLAAIVASQVIMPPTSRFPSASSLDLIWLVGLEITL